MSSSRSLGSHPGSPSSPKFSALSALRPIEGVLFCGPLKCLGRPRDEGALATALRAPSPRPGPPHLAAAVHHLLDRRGRFRIGFRAPREQKKRRSAFPSARLWALARGARGSRACCWSAAGGWQLAGVMDGLTALMADAEAVMEDAPKYTQNEPEQSSQGKRTTAAHRFRDESKALAHRGCFRVLGASTRERRELSIGATSGLLAVLSPRTDGVRGANELT